MLRRKSEIKILSEGGGAVCVGGGEEGRGGEEGDAVWDVGVTLETKENPLIGMASLLSVEYSPLCSCSHAWPGTWC